MSAGVMDGRVAVVVGGAGGLGGAICQVLSAAGARVILTYRSRREAAERIAADLPTAGRAVRVEVEDSTALARLADGVALGEGRCDLLVNCAGTTRFVSHADLDGLRDDLIDEIFRINWRGPSRPCGHSGRCSPPPGRAWW